MRILRSELAIAAEEVSKNMSVAAKQRRKQGFIALLETLVALQEAAQMHAAFAYAHPCSPAICFDRQLTIKPVIHAMRR